MRFYIKKNLLSAVNQRVKRHKTAAGMKPAIARKTVATDKLSVKPGWHIP